MSFLSILLVASAFYFVPITSWRQEAHARPDSQPWPESDAAAQPTDPAHSQAPVTDPRDYQHQLYGFMHELSEAVDKNMKPLMSNIDVKKQDEFKNMALNGFASYINYLLLLIEETKYEKGDGQTQTHGDSFSKNEIILQFESLYPFTTPYMAEIEDEEDEEE